jgi:hypothetical protein
LLDGNSSRHCHCVQTASPSAQELRRLRSPMSHGTGVAGTADRGESVEVRTAAVDLTMPAHLASRRIRPGS